MIETQHAAIAKVYDIGDSWEKTQGIANRDILALKISDNVAADEDEPEVLVTALHHAREWITTETAAALAERLTDSYGTDPQISWLVDNREVWIVPIVNPDGLDYSLGMDEMWRKNRRLNADLTYGVDLNRNYDGSSNGDSMGSWGGVGSSNMTSSEIYCGTSSFSEPETQAIRDLVLGRNFTMALDFHSYGDLVLWPWGYTTNQTPDYDDLSRIGSQLAASNGYVSQQSVGLYPTTGDSLDWMYGYARIFPFTFEVGHEFHPSNASVVAQCIELSLNASVLGIDIAGDREERAFHISHTPSENRNYSSSGFEVEANVTADRGVDSVWLAFSVDGGAWTTVMMPKSTSNNTYEATIPAAPIGAVVGYYVIALDKGGVKRMLPAYSPYDAYGFLVTLPSMPFEVKFTLPTQVDGSASWSLNASIPNYNDAVLTLELHSERLNLTEVYDVPGVGGDNYSVVFPAGKPLGSYNVRLTATIGGFTLWNSTEETLDILDLTAPRISHVAARVIGGPDGRSIEVNVTATDFYGVTEVVLDFNLNGNGPEKAFPTINATDSHNGTWTFQIPLSDDAGWLGYRVRVHDSLNIANHPADLSFDFVSYEPVQKTQNLDLVVLAALFAAIAVAVLVVVAVLLIRARLR